MTDRTFREEVLKAMSWQTTDAARLAALRTLMAARGWRMVPAYASDTMVEAGAAQWDAHAETADNIYTAMLAVAPDPLAPSAQEGE
jgi:hypothetical protein